MDPEVQRAVSAILRSDPAKTGTLKRCRDVGETLCFQLVLPSTFHDQANRGQHKEVGHLGGDRTLELVQERFYWPFMARYVTKSVSSSGRCIERKTPDPPPAPMHSLHTTEPMELLTIGFLSLQEGKGGFSNIFDVTNNFIKLA